ncbi:uncharacterized protein LOC111828572 [Capsella rubella]|uniref:uncharacterized protein LOC111828572 n=1 Tax=Capsella rubella TaxID=81985 RepID=UPI000CD5B87B|nr:uncharacterized protein LOC111828572 [Capsella rubella]
MSVKKREIPLSYILTNLRNCSEAGLQYLGGEVETYQCIGFFYDMGYAHSIGICSICGPISLNFLQTQKTSSVEFGADEENVKAHINRADGKKSCVILESEAAQMDQVNRAQGSRLKIRWSRRLENERRFLR